MKKYILDSTAVLSVILKEKGSDFVEQHLDSLSISAVSFSEVLTKLARQGVSPEEARESIGRIVSSIIPFDADAAVSAEGMAIYTDRLGLSLGDRACIAAARQSGYEIITADSLWPKLKLPVKIRVIG